MKSKRLFAALLMAWLLCPLLGVARAYEVPDLSRKGSITVAMTYNGQAVTGGSLSACYVGQIQEENGDYRFVQSPEMAAFPGDYANISDPKLAEQVAVFVAEQKLSPKVKAENRNGKAVFTDLTLGLYLITQTEASKGFEPINPFLVSVPMNEDGHYVYDVNAKGKFQLHQVPAPSTEPSKATEPTQADETEEPTQADETEEPTQADETEETTQPENSTAPKLPQTGQLNWPIPVLAVIGLLLFSAGWALRFGKDAYEE